MSHRVIIQKKSNIQNYLARNLDVCRVYGLAANLAGLLKTLKGRPRTPNWLLASLEGCVQRANCLIHPLVKHRDEVSPYGNQNFLEKIDWALLREQKTTLAVLQAKEISHKEKEAIEGVLNLLDAIQDYAEDVPGIEGTTEDPAQQ